MEKIDIKKYEFSKTLTPLIRLTLKKNEKFYGPGIVTLFHNLEELGSLQKAAKAMDMSYSKAWNITKRVEKELGQKVIDSKVGGVNGGESILTPFAKEFMSNYEKLYEEVLAYTQKAYKKYF